MVNFEPDCLLSCSTLGAQKRRDGDEHPGQHYESNTKSHEVVRFKKEVDAGQGPQACCGEGYYFEPQHRSKKANEGGGRGQGDDEALDHARVPRNQAREDKANRQRMENEGSDLHWLGFVLG